MGRIKWTIMVIIILLIVGVIPSWKSLLKPFSDECGYNKGFNGGENFKGYNFIKDCFCDGYSFEELTKEGLIKYCFGTCASSCNCSEYNNTTNSYDFVACE